MLARPADDRQNLRYARQRLEKGDLRSAVAALERVLSRNPDLAEARLLRARALQKLGAAEQARAELRLLDVDGVAPETRAQARGLLLRLDDSRRLTHFSVRLALGAGWSSNRNSGTTVGQLLLFDQLVNRPAGQAPLEDEHLSFSAFLEGRRVLDPAQGHEFFASYSYARTDQHRLSQQDLMTHSGQAGLSWRLGDGELIPTARYGYTTVGRNPFRRDLGANLEYVRRFGRGGSVYSGFGWSYEDYASQPADREGRLLDWSVGARLPLGRHAFSTRYAFSDKSASREFWGYQRHALSGELTLSLWRGCYAAGGVAFSDDVYKAADPSLSTSARRDSTWRWRSTLGAPLALVHARLSGLSASANLEHTDNRSTMPNFRYRDTTVSATLSYYWGL